MTFRKFTNMAQDSCSCDADAQWSHWAKQGDVVEPVWTNHLVNNGALWCNWLCGTSTHIDCEPGVTLKEAEECRKRVKPGKAAGPDGILSDVVRRLPALTVLVHLLFTLMLRFGVYPLVRGTALVRAILKPGKPKDATYSLRGIRLISSLASWFSRLLDNRARKAWSPGPEQFGFRNDMGCSEAVALLLALILSRTTAKKRFFVLFVDLRSAFPSLERTHLATKNVPVRPESWAL